MDGGNEVEPLSEDLLGRRAPSDWWMYARNVGYGRRSSNAGNWGIAPGFRCMVVDDEWMGRANRYESRCLWWIRVDGTWVYKWWTQNLTENQNAVKFLVSGRLKLWLRLSASRSREAVPSTFVACVTELSDIWKPLRPRLFWWKVELRVLNALVLSNPETPFWN